MSEFKVGDKVTVKHEELEDHICEIVEIGPLSIRVHHPTKDWIGYYTQISNEWQKEHRIRKLTKLEKALK